MQNSIQYLIRQYLIRLITPFLVLASVAIISFPLGAQEDKGKSQAEIEQIVRGYLLENPELIIESLQLLEQRRAEQQRADQQAMIARNKPILLQSSHHAVLGNPKGDVTLIEFFDYNCNFCRQSLESVERLIEEDKNLRVILKEFPVLGPGSEQAARVAIAAAKIDAEKYLKLHISLLSTRGQVTEHTALTLTEELGFDMDKLREIMSSPVIDEAIGEVYTVAGELGINGTPTFIIGDEVLPGAVGYQILRDKVAAMRDCGKATCS